MTPEQYTWSAADCRWLRSAQNRKKDNSAHIFSKNVDHGSNQDACFAASAR